MPPPARWRCRKPVLPETFIRQNSRSVRPVSKFIAMFRRDTPAEAEFRTEVRAWLEANLPVALRGRTARPPPAELMPWYHALSRKGWIAPHWPRQYGGMGATLNEQIIMTEELARIGAPHQPVQGLNHIGPLLMEFGSEAQKA